MEERHFSLSVLDTILFNPNTHTCPIFRSKHDMELIKDIYERSSILVKEGLPEINPWNIIFKIMFNMTSDSHLFSTYENLEKENFELYKNIFTKGEKQFLPLYESKLVYQFNHRYATFNGVPFSERFKLHARTNEASVSELRNPYFITIPRYWVPKEEVHLKSNNWRWFIGFRKAISAVADVRSFIASVIPYGGVGDSMPLLRCAGDPLKSVILLSMMNSFVLDYILRQKANSGNLNLFVFYQLPIPHPSNFFQFKQWCEGLFANWILPHALELTYTAWDLEAFAKDCGYAGPPFRWNEERRFLLRCELDAAYFHLYGIAREDVDYIMDTFRVWKERDEKQLGEYRTKRVILEIYEEMQRAIETGEPYRTRLDPPPADPAVAHEPRSGVEV